MLKGFKLLVIVTVLSACGKSEDTTATRGDSEDIKAVWTWQSGTFKLLDQRSTNQLDLSTVDYGTLSANKYYDMYFADADGAFDEKLSVRTDVTFQETDLKFFDYGSMTVMDCDQDLLVDCATAPNAPMANQGGPWDGTMTYYSDGSTLEICFDEDCGVYTK